LTIVIFIFIVLIIILLDIALEFFDFSLFDFVDLFASVGVGCQVVVANRGLIVIWIDLINILDTELIVDYCFLLLDVNLMLSKLVFWILPILGTISGSRIHHHW
jgi:hypothetical protein